MITAAPVITPAVWLRPSAIARVWSRVCQPDLPHAGEQEDLVVDREDEHDRQHPGRRDRVDVAGADQQVEPEEELQGAERRRDRQQVERDGDDRQQQRAQHRHQHQDRDERERDDEPGEAGHRRVGVVGEGSARPRRSPPWWRWRAPASAASSCRRSPSRRVAGALGPAAGTTSIRTDWPPPSTLTSCAICSRVAGTVPSSAVSIR